MGYKTGDIVQLKSGGPKMTVQGIVGVTTNDNETSSYNISGHSFGELICTWFSGTQLEKGIFKHQMVEKVLG